MQLLPIRACLAFLSAFIAPLAVEAAAPVVVPPPPGGGAAAAAQAGGRATIHEFDRYLLVFHFEELTDFDEVGNLVQQQYKFGNKGIEINPIYVSNQHKNSGTVHGKGGVNQVVILETPVNDASVASVNFIEATAGGINAVTIFEVHDDKTKENVMRCYYTRMMNVTDHKENKSKQRIVVNKGLAYPVDKEGEYIAK